jgi:putative transposase
MKWLQGTWTTRFNRFRRVVGRPFQGRYKAFHVEPGYTLAQVAHYIHLNPLSVGNVTGDTLAEYRWSSLHRLVRRRRPVWLLGKTVLEESGGLEDTAAGWRSYQEYLALLATELPDDRERKFAALCRGWAIGSTQFQEELRVKLEQQPGSAQRFALLGSDAAAVRQARAQLWEHQLQAIAEAAGIALARLPTAKSSPDKVLLAALLKEVASVSNRWLGERLDMGGASSVSSLVTRFQRQGLAHTAEFRALYSRFAT